MMFALKPRSGAFAGLRRYSTEPTKPSIKLVAELRKLTEVSINKAREALVASGNDVQGALRWLEEDRVASGAKKAEKLAGRTANEGLIGVSILSRGIHGADHASNGSRAAMVELNCETDFVARNELFGALLADISHTAAYMAEINPKTYFRAVSVDALQDAPLLSATGTTMTSGTVGSAIRDLITKVGEKVSLRRATAHAWPAQPSSVGGTRIYSYLHGSVGLPSQGRIGALGLNIIGSAKLQELLASEPFREDLAKLERSLARQIVGFPTTSVRPSQDTADGDETALYSQQFMMHPGSNGQTVEAVLDQWAEERGLREAGDGGISVLGFEKWAVGEPIAE